MTAILTVIVALAMSVGLGQAQAERTRVGASQTDKETLTRLVNDYYDARVRRDAGTLDRIMAEDFTGIFSSNGHLVGKAQSIKNFTSPDGPTYEFIKVDDLEVRIYGATAVVTCRATEKGTYRGADGERHSISTESDGLYPMRATFVFVKQRGQWRIVAEQATHLT